MNNLNEVKKYCLLALEIKQHPKTYINEVFSWDHTIDDLLSICFYYENNMKEALKHVNNALKYLPNNDRLLKNKELIETTMANNISWNKEGLDESVEEKDLSKDLLGSEAEKRQRTERTRV